MNPFFHDMEKDVLLNPRIIFDKDPGEKRKRYQQIASLTDYVVVEQERPLVEHWTRAEDQWTVSTLEGLSATLALDAIACSIALSDIYDRITW